MEAKLAIVGGGPAGYGAALAAAENGVKAVLVEENRLLGGTCLREGCIPTKTLLESSRLFESARGGHEAHGIGFAEVRLDLAAMQRRKQAVIEQLAAGLQGLMKRAAVEIFQGSARLESPGVVVVASADGEQIEIRPQKTILATGSAPMAIAGLEFDGKRILTSSEALALEQAPRRLVVVGGGAVGLELGQLWHRLGAEVTVIEMMPHILPAAGKRLAAALARSLKKQGLEILESTRVLGCRKDADELELMIENKAGQKTIRAERVLVAVGRRPRLPAGLSCWGLALDERGRVRVDERLQTPRPGVFAAGDIVTGPMLAHKAHYDGETAARNACGGDEGISYAAIPSVVYTWPEFASVGLSEEQCDENGADFTVGRAYFQANGRALSTGDAEGLAEVIAEKGSGKLLGVHLVGPHASELIAEAVLALSLGLKASDIAGTVHAHPTLGETLKEAARAAQPARL